MNKKTEKAIRKELFGLDDSDKKQDSVDNECTKVPCIYCISRPKDWSMLEGANDIEKTEQRQEVQRLITFMIDYLVTCRSLGTPPGKKSRTIEGFLTQLSNLSLEILENIRVIHPHYFT